MKEKIYEKLSEKLKVVPKSESDVVYILSRIRKILEIDKKKDKYSTLNFYCNWALHSIIDRPPKSIYEKLIKIKNGHSSPNEAAMLVMRFDRFTDLHEEFKIFLKEYGLPNIIYSEKNGVRDFNKFLLSIYSDTPIVLTMEEKFEVKLDEPSANGIYGLSIHRKIE